MGRITRRFAVLVLGSLILAVSASGAPPPGGVDLLSRAQIRVDGGASNVLGSWVENAGDVNGDGRADYLLESPTREVVLWGPSKTGVIDIGSSSGWGYRINVDTSIGVLACCGTAALGDVNLDGRPDFAIGDSDVKDNGLANSGSAWVVFGKSDTAPVNIPQLGNGGYRINGESEGDRLGLWVARAGDVNGDNRPDLLVGAHVASYNGRFHSGSVYVVFGKSDTATIDLGKLGQGGFRIDGVQPDDRIGLAQEFAGAGDVNGDKRADVVIGSCNGTSNGGTRSGSAWVVYGKADSARVDLASLGNAGYRIVGAQSNDCAGGRVANAGDINGDGRADTLVGAPVATPAKGYLAEGAVYVVYGQAQPRTIDLATINAAASGGKPVRSSPQGYLIASIASPGREQESHYLDLFGDALSQAGDVNGDGVPDALIGAPQYCCSEALGSGQGAAFVVYGQTRAPLVDVGKAGTWGYRLDGPRPFSGTGISVAGAGDLNGDGRPEALVGDWFDSNNGLQFSGSAFFYFDPLPLVRTGPARPLPRGAVQVSGTIAGTGSIDGYWFEYGQSRSLSEKTASARRVGVKGVAAATILRGLKAGGTYFYRLAAATPIGTSYGRIRSVRVPG